MRITKMLIAACLAAFLLVACGGEAEEETTETTVFVDTEAPEIIGVKDYTVYVGDKIDFLEGIDVKDNSDSALSLQVDQNAVFLDYPGVYTVIYIACDASGNETRSYATVTVLEN